MNRRIILYILCLVMRLEAVMMVPALVIALYQGEAMAARGFMVAIVALLACSLLTFLRRPKHKEFFSREGFLAVVGAWFVVALFGAIPFFASGAIPNFIDCIFETVSGFTTTGATILSNVEALPMSLLYWRAFTQWLGGMGVLVFIIALIPLSKNTGHSMNLVSAESPGLQVDKMVPRMQNYAKILYGTYIGLTVAQIVLYIAGGMNVFESVTTSFSVASTGGFHVLNSSMAGYSPYLQNVATVFMLLCGTSFNVFILLMLRDVKKAFKNEELWLYLAIVGVAIAAVTVNVLPVFAGVVGEALHHSSFQVASIMTTTGLATVDFNIWPQFSRSILVILMVIGACAGSTAGGLKVARVLMLGKTFVRDMKKLIRPRSVSLVRMNGSVVDSNTVRGVRSFLTAYILVAVISIVLVSIDNLSVETNISAVAACLNNVGPGLDIVGPLGNYSQFSGMSKIVLSADMLIGRLEVFPVLLLFAPSMWKR